jgi:chromosome segregation ATPase
MYMAANFVTRAEQDDLISYLDRKFDRIDQRFETERKHNDARFDALVTATQQNSKDIQALAGIVASLAQTASRLEMTTERLVVTTEQNSADIRRLDARIDRLEFKMETLHSDVQAIARGQDKLITTVRALVKLAPPDAFATAYKEVEEERDFE